MDYKESYHVWNSREYPGPGSSKIANITWDYQQEKIDSLLNELDVLKSKLPIEKDYKVNFSYFTYRKYKSNTLYMTGVGEEDIKNQLVKLFKGDIDISRLQEMGPEMN
jgi:hypothetical protein